MKEVCEHTWIMIWFKAVVEEGKPVSLYQCIKCKDIKMDSED